MASRRLASSGKEANYRETGENEDEEDEEWIEPIKVTSKNNRRHRDKNSPRRTKVTGSSSKLGSYSGTSSSSSSTKGDMWNFITAAGEFALHTVVNHEGARHCRKPLGRRKGFNISSTVGMTKMWIF